MSKRQESEHRKDGRLILEKARAAQLRSFLVQDCEKRYGLGTARGIWDPPGGTPSFQPNPTGLHPHVKAAVDWCVNGWLVHQGMM